MLCRCSASNGTVVCYYGSWSNSRAGAGSFGVSDIPTSLCTHLIYSFVDVSLEGEIIKSTEEETIDGKSNTMADFIALNESNPDLKLMVAIGGWSAGSTNFSTVVNNDTLRQTFVNNVVAFLSEYGFQGFDLDWEYPSQRGGADTDKEQFITLIKELREPFDENGWLLTAAVAVTQSNIDLSYDVVNLTTYLDFIHLMTYDFHGTWETETGVNAPLYPQLTDAADSVLNVNTSVNVWISNGASPSKLVLGIGAYGKTFTLTNLTETGTGAPSSGAGAAGPYLAEAGAYSYYEICEAQLNDTDAWNVTEVTGSYVYGNDGSFWVGYDNANTAYAKGAFAKSMGLAGVMYWAVDLDDFGALCGSEFPIIKAGIAGYNC